MRVGGVGFGSVSDIAVAGIRKGYAQLQHAGETIARATTTNDGDTVAISDRARQLAAAAQPDLIDGLLELRTAGITVAANTATVKAADEMARDAINLAKR
jgi:hypothetical protein